MNDIKIFNNTEFGNIRVTEQNGEPWFVGKDIASALGYAKPENAIAAHVDDADKTTTLIQGNGSNYKSKAVLINESGLYSLILSSKLPTAKEFKHWVTSEILPSIRKTGGYISGQENMSDSELMAKALIVAQQTIEQRDVRIKQLQTDNAALTVDKQIMQPKADYFDQIVDRNLLTNFRDTAKQLGIKPRTFTSWLLEHKYLFRDKHGKLNPYEAKNNGLFEIKEFVNEKTGFASTQTLVTPRGRETFRLLCEGL